MKSDPAAIIDLAGAIKVWSGDSQTTAQSRLAGKYRLGVHHSRTGRLIVVVEQHGHPAKATAVVPVTTCFVRERQLAKFGRQYGVEVPDPLIPLHRSMGWELRAALAVPAGGRGPGGLFGAHRTPRQIRLVRDYLERSSR